MQIEPLSMGASIGPSAPSPYQNSMVIFMIPKVSSIMFAMSSKWNRGPTYIFLRFFRCRRSALFGKILKKNNNVSKIITIRKIYIIPEVSQISSNHQGVLISKSPIFWEILGVLELFQPKYSTLDKQRVNFTKSRIFQKVFVNIVWKLFKM